MILTRDQVLAIIREELARSPPGKWLCQTGAASYLGLSPGTLENWRSSGKGPRWRVMSNLVRYSIKDLDALCGSGFQ